MKLPLWRRIAWLLIALVCATANATDRYVSLAGGHVSPFTSWANASTNIQAAIDAATEGDVVWVTNGVYNTGGKVVDEDMTNRVVLDKALTVQSVNGPKFTTIEGAGTLEENSGVRCAWLTNNAVLKGFTLAKGTSRIYGNSTMRRGGGVWCSSSDALVANCIIVSNSAELTGAAAYRGTLVGCYVNENTGGWGGPAVHEANLINCTVTSNSFGVREGLVTNSIVYFNANGNWEDATMFHSGTTPLPPGEGNFESPPQLLDGIHLASTSPCRGSGTNWVTGTDIDGHAWNNPPSVGCDEWNPAPQLSHQPTIRFDSSLNLYTISARAFGAEPLAYWWIRNGAGIEEGADFGNVHSTNLIVRATPLLWGAGFQIVVSNAFGMITSSVARVSLRYVAATTTTPSPPFTNWATAAATIQDAIDAAQPGDVVLVTNGVYRTGGKVVDGNMLNRVVLDKALTVQSVNGPKFTTIEGEGITAEDSGVRCAWLTNHAVLKGFTLTKGASRIFGGFTMSTGGGVWCSSSDAVVANCVIVSNTAFSWGFAAYRGTLVGCQVSDNIERWEGAAVSEANLVNCTVTRNTIGVYACLVTNSIVHLNDVQNSISATMFNSCTTPLPDGAGNFESLPQLLDGVHLASNSPCRGAGIYWGSGTDIDGHAWNNPPSVGCDEWNPAPQLSHQPTIQFDRSLNLFTVNAPAFGNEPLNCRWSRNGVGIEAGAEFGNVNSTNLIVRASSLLWDGGFQIVVSNAFGMITSSVVQLPLRYVNAATTTPSPPFTSWATAAATIQDAIDAAQPGEVVLVTNGVYNSGGKVVDGNLTNRIAIDKPIVVHSVNGPAATIIQGQFDPVATNGPGAVRCAWLTDNAALIGFTLRGGATRAFAGSLNERINGGGVWGASTAALVMHCIIATNAAARLGGGAYQVTLDRCSLVGNRTYEGGGANLCMLRNCTIVGNASTGHGGGAAYSDLRNCSVIRNHATLFGSGVYEGNLVNCTIYDNSSGPYGYYGGGVVYCALTNCIVYGNRVLGGYTNYYESTFSYSCTTPLPPGAGNIDVDPQLFEDGIHLFATSPCRGTGTNFGVSLTDIDNQPWATPPSMGCDEWSPLPQIIRQPTVKLTAKLGVMAFGVIAAGQPPFTCSWSKDGIAIGETQHFSSTATTNLVVNGFGPSDTGAYRVVVSNAFGMATSAVVQVVVRGVNIAGTNPVLPYTTWATAATSIQDAIDAAAPGEFIVVTNGNYATGGKVMFADLTNRIAITKPLTIMSVNGPDLTTISGFQDPTSTNGPLAIRCAWLTNGAILAGFTLTGGATRSTGDSNTYCGGAIWSNSREAMVVNCRVIANAAVAGGGNFGASLERCSILNNVATHGGGGGSGLGKLTHCYVEGNRADWGGGTSSSELINCTVVRNYAKFAGGGVNSYELDAPLTSCIVISNLVPYDPAPNIYAPFSVSLVSYTCSAPLPAGVGNINADPQLLDSIHIAITSPCYGTGNPLYTTGFDIDGEAVTAPPSIGCDAVVPAALVGPLSVTIEAAQTNRLVNRSLALTGRIVGRASRLAWSFGDGPIYTNLSYLTSHAWANAGDYTVTCTAYNVDYPGGVSANLVVHVEPLAAPQLAPAGLIGTNFSLSFMGQAGVNYIVEQTTNLAPPVTWLPVQSLLSTGGLVQITDPKATNAMRFYRVRAQ